MALLEKELEVKESTIPNAGKGLFTKVFIPKSTPIVEYKGTITTWKEVKEDHTNPYIFYVKAGHVIDARHHLKSLARYANDAKGLTRTKNKKNNACFDKEGVRVYLIATKDIQAGEEILVEYGTQYWQTMRQNIRIDKKNGH